LQTGKPVASWDAETMIENNTVIEKSLIESSDVDSGDKALILMQSLICYLREKNVLSRADIEELRDRVEARIAATESHLSCAASLAAAAASEMRELDDYCGKKYGGKHRRRVN
jgi:hypothetical protein